MTDNAPTTPSKTGWVIPTVLTGLLILFTMPALFLFVLAVGAIGLFFWHVSREDDEDTSP